MSIRPWVIVEEPDGRGLRRVTIGGETVGSAWSAGELRRMLGRRGYPVNMDLDDPTSICWRGGDSRTWPDRAWRRRAAAGLMVAGLLASMVLNAVIGWPDATGALTFAQRMTGGLFVLSGLVQGAAAGMVLDYWGRRQLKLSGAVVLLAVLIALATDTLLLVMWMEETEYTPYLLAFVPLWCWSLWALVLLAREKPWRGAPQPKTFAAGLVVTALLTGASLAYSTMYQPAAAPMHFTLSAKFGTARPDRREPFVHVPLTLYMKNTGGIPVYIVNDIYTVRGRDVAYSRDSGTRDLLAEWEESAGKGGGLVGETELYVDDFSNTTISSGQFYGPGERLEVGQEYALERVVQLPVDAEYETVSVRLQVSYMRKDRGKLDVKNFSAVHYSWNKSDEKYYCPSEGGCGRQLIYHGRVWHNNNLINVTRKPRYVTAIWSPVGRLISSISSFRFQDERGFYSEEKRELDRYGAASVRADAEVSVAELLGSAGR
ncbi:hypothetical protein ACWCQQ_06855 [Streptomyces sp. NPDC002143]